MDRDLKFHFVTVVWGEEYSDFYTDVVIPNYLSDGNIPAFVSEDAVYKIYTPLYNISRIENSASFKKLSGIIKTEIIPMPENIDVQGNWHEAMSHCHRLAISDALKCNAGVVSISPDSIISQDSLANLLRLAKSGKKAVMIAGVRLVKEDVSSELVKNFCRDGVITIKSHQLVGLMMKYLHPISQRLFWDSEEFSLHPSHLYFKVGDEGLVARCFHLHPLFFKPDRQVEFALTIDGDMISNAGFRPDEVYIVTDSYEILACEMSSYDKRFERPIANKASSLNVAWWAKSWADYHHREYLNYKMRFESRPYSNSWYKTERYSDKVVERINFWRKYERFFIKIPVKQTIKRMIINPAKKINFYLVDVLPFLFLNKPLKKFLLKLGLFYYLKEKKIRFYSRRIVRRTGLCGPVCFEPIFCGGNSRVYKLSVAGSHLLLKYYFYHQMDKRDRLGAEYHFLSFLSDNRIKSVPKPLGCDGRNALGLYEFVEGRKLKAGEVLEQHIQQAVGFFKSINALREKSRAAFLPCASEACFSMNEHIFCVERRLAALQGIEASLPVDIDAKRFINEQLNRVWQDVKDGIVRTTAELDWDLDIQLPKEQRCLSPSDFGFHNALLKDDGTLCFIDFEYAGWDDPAKMTCDFFSQPDVPVPMDYYSNFEDAVVELSPEREKLRQRIRLLLPLYKLKWCCIMLNEFLPFGAARRGFMQDVDSAGRKEIQLQKVQRYLSDFRNNFQLKELIDGLH